MSLVLAIDQGTSGTKAALVDAQGAIIARGSAPLGEAHPAGTAPLGRRSTRC